MMLSLFIIILIILCPPVFAENPKVYSDDDLEIYGRGIKQEEPDAPISKEQPQYDLNISDTSKREQAEIWCQRSTKAKDRIERAKQALADSEITELSTRATYGRRYIGADAVATTSVATDRARKELRDAEDEYNRLIEEADRKSIPPGWLYCNY